MENFESIFVKVKTMMKTLKYKLTLSWLRMAAFCNISIFQYYLDNDNMILLNYPLKLIEEQLILMSNLYIEKQSPIYLNYIEIIMYWLIQCYYEKPMYLEEINLKFVVI